MALPFTFTTDKTGFPVVETPDLPFAVLWLPVTKIQFEHFLVDTGIYDNDWYQEILQKFDGRVSAGSGGISNYWQLFMTGILPREAHQYAEWCGYGFDLPTSNQWKDAIRCFARWRADTASLNALLTMPQLNERARLIVKTLDTVTQEDAWQLNGGRLLCDQMGMRLGVMEIAYETSQRSSFCCWGQPSKRLYGAISDPLRETEPMHFINRTEGTRMRHGGFRLIRSK
ncbi:MAG TPA: SUMF1/EgtB/PvdO family nonheme iron enzyme [Ktedonobacteraceae bacterium]|nr:SUMF1/EgtB/PvdO family nonheme iron enzyme [Ktedonobacteraceae bacterium]